jgi:sugar/nucleoside kinase (ribokinase family)
MKTVPIIDFGPHQGPAVCVVGSLNADLIADESDTWIPGAYNVGDRFELGAGGKGLNVAMSIAATGLPAYLVGRVGNDMFGHFLQRRLTLGSVSQDFVSSDSSAATGVGHVRVNAHRDYDTCVVPGANDRVDASDTTSALGRGIAFSHVVMAFEIPLPTVIDTARRFRAAGTQVVVNFSPVSEDSRSVLPHTDVLAERPGGQGRIESAVRKGKVLSVQSGQAHRHGRGPQPFVGQFPAQSGWFDRGDLGDRGRIELHSMSGAETDLDHVAGQESTGSAAKWSHILPPAGHIDDPWKHPFAVHSHDRTLLAVTGRNPVPVHGRGVSGRRT